MKQRRRSASQKKQAGKQNSFIDPVTGQRVVSDVIYGPGSTVSKSYGSEFEHMVEYELSSKQIVLTVSAVPRGGVVSDDPGGAERFVFEGEFFYSPKGEFSGRLDRWSQGTFYARDFPAGAYEYVDTLELVKAQTFRGSSEFRSLAIASNPGGELPTRNIFAYEANSSASTFATRSEEGIALSTDKSPLAFLGLASFYGGEWWNNLFNGNLIPF
jgi:hypothetical protein